MRGDGSVRRCGPPRRCVCVCCVRRGIRRSGGIVRGRLWRPYRPFQVIGVLAAVLPIARKSQQFSRSAECAGKLPTPAQVNLAKSGERLHANTAPIPWAASNARQCSTKLPRGSYRTNSSCCNQRSQRLEEVDGFFVRSELESMGGEFYPRYLPATEVGVPQPAECARAPKAARRCRRRGVSENS